MFKKLLNVGKGISNDKLQQQQQQQQKNLFQLNEIRSYGFSHLTCIGHSPSLSLLAVGSKSGLLRVLGNSSVEFSFQLEPASSIRQIEFIDCRHNVKRIPVLSASPNEQESGSFNEQLFSTSAKIVALTDNGQLHLFELKTFKQQVFADNTTQTDGSQTTTANDCCHQQSQQPNDAQQAQQNTPDYTKLEHTGLLGYFKCKPDDEDRSRRITTLELSADGQIVFVGTEGGNVYLVPLSKFEPLGSGADDQQVQLDTNDNNTVKPVEPIKEDETEAVDLSDEPQIVDSDIVEPFEMIKFDENIASYLAEKSNLEKKKQGAIESIKRHPASNTRLLLSYHRGLSIIYDLQTKSVWKYFNHNQILESSCFNQNGDLFYTSHNDGSYVRWDTRNGPRATPEDDAVSQLYGPYPCKPTPKIQAATSLVNDQLEDLVIFSGGMPRATYDDKNPVTIVRVEKSGKGTIKTVLDFTSKVLDFVVITRPLGNLGAGAKSGGQNKKNKHKQQQQQQRNNPIAVALAILAEEEFVVIDLLNSESYLEFPLPYLNCVHSSAITCNQHYSDICDELYEQLLTYNKQQLKGKLSVNEWPITGGKVIEAPELKSHDILLTGHEDGSVDFWDVSDLSMRHLLHLSTARFFSTNEDDLVPIAGLASDQDGASNETPNATTNNESDQQDTSSAAWPPLKRVGRFDPYSDDTRLAIRRLSLCPHTGTLVTAGTGGQVLVFELKHEAAELQELVPDELSIVSDQRFTWKGCKKLAVKPGGHKFEPGYHLSSYVQLEPPVAATSLDLRSDWKLYALGTSYGFYLYDYANKHTVAHRCTLNMQDFAIVSGDTGGVGTISRKKSFRKSLRESFRRLRRGRSQRNQPQTGIQLESDAPKPAFSRPTTGVRALNAPSGGGAAAAEAPRNVYSTERQVEQKVELSSIVKCITLTSAIIATNSSFRPTLWVGTNSGQVLVYAITLANDQEQQQQLQQKSSDSTPSADTQDHQDVSNSDPSNSDQPPRTTAKLAKEIQLKHKAPIIAIFTSPEAPQQLGNQSATESADKSVTESPDRKSPNESDNQSSERAQTPAPSEPSKSPKKEPKQVEQPVQQPRVLICSEEQFKVFNLPNLKPFCKFKLTAHEGLRAKKISITQFLKPVSSNKPSQHQAALVASKSLQSFATQTSAPASPVPPTDGTASTEQSASINTDSTVKQSEHNNNSLTTLNNNHTNNPDSKELMNAKFGVKSTSQQQSTDKEAASSDQVVSLFEPYMVCMSNQGDCAIYSVPDLKRQAQIQVCKREDVNGITSTMLTNYGEGYYLKSSSNFLRFSISTQRVLRVLTVV